MPLLLHLLERLPLSLLYRLAAVASVFVYRVARYRRATVDANLARAFPERSTAERRQLARAFYRHLCNLSAEILAAPRLTPAELRRRVVFENVEVLTPFVEREQSMLMLTCHQGNWEWLLHAVALALPCPVDPVYKPLHNRHFDAFMRRVRSHLSGRPIAFQDAGKEILRRRREFRAFAMVADQAPFKKDKRYWRDFLGSPASFYFGPQKIAELTQHPVFYVRMLRERRGHYRVHFELLAEPPHPKDDHAILDRYIDAVAAAVRAQPETWLWSNRKWKHLPPAEFGSKGSA